MKFTKLPALLLSESAIKRLPMVEIAPGKTSPQLPRSAVRRFFFVEMVWAADGTIHPVLRKFPSMARISIVSQCLGISPQTINRLLLNGFVEYSQNNPKVKLVCLASLVRHLKACSEPGFWTLARREKYNSAIY